MPKLLKIIGYILIGIVSFVMFLYLTFPFDVIKDRLLAEIEKSSKGEAEEGGGGNWHVHRDWTSGCDGVAFAGGV